MVDQRADSHATMRIFDAAEGYEQTTCRRGGRS
jgi:hypothetical protein